MRVTRDIPPALQLAIYRNLTAMRFATARALGPLVPRREVLAGRRVVAGGGGGGASENMQTQRSRNETA